MNKLTILIFGLLLSLSTSAQYQITDTKEVSCTDVKSQNRTGTCWSFATTSFIESELMRTGKGAHDLSEMFIVRNIYSDKARNYLLRQGNAGFSQGSLSHDMIRMIAEAGVVPESVYSGKLDNDAIHDHSEMEAGLKGYLDGIRTQKRLSSRWDEGVDALLDVYMGPEPTEFKVDGKTYDPKSYAGSLGLKPSEYVNLTSFNHHPFGDEFILEIPDNYSNGSYHNMRLDEFISVIDKALSAGYSVAWDGDVSEKGFAANAGIAVLPVDENRTDLHDNPGEEVVVTQENRQENFESLATTDDHLMHIVGLAKDQNGTKYYKIKNSWGTISPHHGFLYMSEAYMRMKTVSLTVHQDMVPKSVLKAER
jgi:bleomycin hydrolase